MSGSAPCGPRKSRRTPHAGLVTAWKLCPHVPDPIGLDAIRGNNRKQLRELAKLIHCLCDGQSGTRFFLGSVSLGMLLNKPQRTVHRWTQQLERQGIIRRTWVGRPCKKDERGRTNALGKAIDRASEFVYEGLLQLT